MKKLLSVGVIVLFLGLAIAPSINADVSKASIDSELVEITTEICGSDDGYQSEYIFIGFILDVEIGREYGSNYSYFYLEFLYTLWLHYRNGELISRRIEKYPYAIKIQYKEANIKGYIGSFFICAKLSSNLF